MDLEVRQAFPAALARRHLAEKLEFFGERPHCDDGAFKPDLRALGTRATARRNHLSISLFEEGDENVWCPNPPNNPSATNLRKLPGLWKRLGLEPFEPFASFGILAAQLVDLAGYSLNTSSEYSILCLARAVAGELLYLDQRGLLLVLGRWLDLPNVKPAAGAKVAQRSRLYSFTSKVAPRN